MTKTPHCSRCGAPLDEGGHGLCPACLLKGALDASPETATSAQSPITAGGTSASHSVPDRIGPYRILQQLGEGGMGVVYLAEQERPLRRRVAVKIIKLGMDTREVVARFDAERQALALMDHPNIASVFDAGATDDGRPYFVMEYVPGVAITQYCDTHRLSTRARLALFSDVCAAVQHAHQKGIIHRDIKPSNVLVQVQDGKPLPKVIDFGIAKATDQRRAEATEFTQHGVFVGTPEYMSPEQAGAAEGDVDTRSDIYSAGVLLYELLVGAVPFESARLRRAAYGELQRIIREEEPARPSTKLSTLGATASEVAERRQTTLPTLSRELRGDLDWITLKALEKDRGRRYASASELAADIGRHLADEPIVARPASMAYRTRKFVRRHKGAVVAAAALLAMLVTGLTVSTVLFFNAERARHDADRQRGAAVEASRVALAERDRAERAANAEASAGAREATERRHAEDAQRLAEERKRAAESALNNAERNLYYNYVDLADREWQANRILRTDELLDAAPSRLRNWEWHYLKRLCHMESAVLRGHKGAVNDVAFVEGGELMVSAGDDGALRVWDARTYRHVANLEGHTGKIIDLATSRDGRILVSLSGLLGGVEERGATGAPISEWSEVSVWTPADGRRLLSLPRSRYTAIAISPDGQRVVVSVSPVGTRSEIRMWDVASGKELSTLGEVPGRIFALVLSPDATRLAVETRRTVDRPLPGGYATLVVTNVTVRDVATGEAHFTIAAGEVYFRGGTPSISWPLRYAADGQSLITGVDKTLRRWSAADGKEIWSVQLSHEINRIAVSTHDHLAVTSKDNGIRLYDAATGRERERLYGHPSGVASVSFSPDGARLISAGEDGTLRVWHPTPDNTPIVLDGPPAVFSGSLFGDRVMLKLPDATNPVAYSSDGRMLATGTASGSMTIWNARTGDRILALPTQVGPIRSAAFNPDGSRLVLVSNADSVTLWDARTGHQVLTLRETNGSHEAREFRASGEALVADRESVAFSNDGQRIILTTVKYQGQRPQIMRPQFTGTIQAHTKTWHAEPRFVR